MRKYVNLSSLRGFEKAEAIQKSKIDGCFTLFSNPVDCHDSAIAESRNDKKTAQIMQIAESNNKVSLL
ncbi:hypothetical protein ACWIUD_07405 [Helicobacter sp. 23-1044]